MENYSPFRTVHFLSLALCVHGTTTEGLFRYFPSLVALELRKVSSDSILPAGPFPPSLVRVLVRAATSSNAPVDYAAPLAPWQGLRVSSLRVTAAVSPLPVLAMFTAAQQQRPWTLIIGRTIKVSAGQHGQASIELHPRDWDRAWLSQIHPYTSHLSHVKLRPTRILELVNSGLNLPALETITLEMKGAVPRELFDVERQLAQGTVRAPKLRTLVVSVGTPILWSTTRDALCWAAECLPKLLRTWILYDAASLESITVVMPRAERSRASEDSFAELSALAGKFSLSYAGDTSH
ncbi:hypothetical protein AURDEDRAFT_117011 [Auricularia subglabra TFB-10046 SS5]|nr:hypothetical protein AURDEDRAFT_117011 [Auricularia subglabra TFB-10046 SS5]